MLDQVPVAFVIRAPGEKRSEAEHAEAILANCRAKLASFKVPRAVWFRDEFPVATLEKVAKNKLREIADEMPDPGEGKR
jgi:crotonobetaine/carnitine-CoA ligase